MDEFSRISKPRLAKSPLSRFCDARIGCEDYMRALVVEDDASAWRGLELSLKSARIIADQTDMGEEALDLARRYDYDIILLDLKLPDMEGADVIRRLRAARIDTPVLVLSGSSKPETKAQALRLGADDFLSKPFDRTELLARVQAIVRRCRGFSDTVLRAGSLELNLGSHEVTFHGRSVALTGKEFAILELMVLRKGSIISKEAFLSHLYGGMDEPELKIIDVFICKLRKKLALAGAGNVIGTVWGRGYVVREQSMWSGPQFDRTPGATVRA
jgi:two-component system, cell cycle response regulator CtrA